MARYLSLDWDYQQLHIVSATVGRGGVQIQKSAVWNEEKSPNPADAEACGRLLRERLKEAGIAPAPVLVCVGRDRLILKDVRYPTVPANEEPALVKFQAVKELTDPADEVVIDYTPSADPGPNGEQKALAVIARRELVLAYQTMCKAAGLKLLAVGPRPFGALACLKHVAGMTVLTPPPEPPDAAVAVVTVSDHWAEFCVGRGERLQLARALTVGDGLAGEIRRSVGVYSGQAPQHPVRAVYIASSTESGRLRDRLQDLLGVPIYPLDPFAGGERAGLPTAHRGAYAGAVGLLQLWAEHGKLPINFVQPKEPKPPKDPNKRKMLLAAGVAAAMLVASVAYCYNKLAERDQVLAQLALQRSDLDRRLLVYEEDAKRIKAIDDWNRTDIPWLDELYDLTDRFPDTEGMRLSALTMSSIDPATKGTKDKHTGKMTLIGVFNDLQELHALQLHFMEDSTYGDGSLQLTRNTGTDVRRFMQKFTTKIDVEKRPADKYVREMEDLNGEGERPQQRPNGGRANRQRGRGRVNMNLGGEFGGNLP